MRRLYCLLSFALIMALGVPAGALAQDYVLGEGDLLKISVYENEDLASVTRVSGEGAISFPLVGQVKVTGLTVLEAEQKLTGLLANGYVIDPHVSILVTEYWSKRVTILGEITKPGLYELNGNVTLIEIISRAGGLTDKAGDTLVIQRKQSNSHAGGQDPENGGISVSLKNLMEKGDLSVNLVVQDGDSIFINRAGFVYVTGEVNKPGAYKIDDGTTVIMAITLAGGLTDKASPGRTSIIRKNDGGEKKSRVDMNYSVQPDDVITVPESFF